MIDNTLPVPTDDNSMIMSSIWSIDNEQTLTSTGDEADDVYGPRQLSSTSWNNDIRHNEDLSSHLPSNNDQYDTDEEDDKHVENDAPSKVILLEFSHLKSDFSEVGTIIFILKILNNLQQ